MEDTWNKSLSEEASIVTDLFKGQLVNIMYCLNWKKKIYDFDNFECISLEIPNKKEGGIKLIDWFYETMKKNYFPKEMGFKCSKCNCVTSIYKEQRICRLPKILAIHLKRFEFDNQGEKKKKNDSVEIPLTITELDGLFYNYEAEHNFNKEYKLYAISKHSGSLNSGHYVADVNSMIFKGGRYRDEDSWYNWNDNYVSKCQPTLNGSTPYVLFYFQEDMKRAQNPDKLHD